MKLCLGCMEYYGEKYDVCPHCGFIEGTEAEEAYHMQPGTVLHEKYLIGRVLGYGGFGVTYMGWDQEMERKVAVKEYLPSEFSTRMPESTQVTVFSGDKEEQFQSGLDKFIDEAKRLAKFHSANGIIHIFDSFKENNTAYIVMEYLEGETLKEKIAREGKIEIDEALSIILPILYALKEVHKIGIIHRDIAPDNIYLTNEKDEHGNRIVKLLDFGAARFSTTKYSRSLSVLVKPGYSPEEQYRSKGDQGTWTDVYSAAATLYRMITGVIPQASIERSVKDELKQPSKLGIKINKSLENAILNGMNVKIENRTQTVDVLIEELESEQTKRRKEHIRHVDIGKWPLWLKVTSGSLASAVAVFIILLAVGIIRFPGIMPDASSVPKGQTRVPNVINLSVEKAEKQAKKKGLEFQIVDKEYSSDIGVGKVLKQNHLGGSLIELEDENTKTKGTLAVTISAGEEMTYVPEVENFMLELAQQQIADANLVSTTKEEEGDDAPGTVASQSIEPMTEVAVGTDVALIVSTGRNFDSSIMTTVPNIVGMTYADAKALMIQQCLYLAKSEVRASDDIPKGQIMEQSVAEGNSIAQNSTITVVVSAGQEMTYVPDVQYKTEEEAANLLQAQKLKVKVKEKESNTVQKGRVISQSVESGTQVKVGTEVIIYISKGNSKADNTITANDIVITQDIQKDYETEAETEQPVIEISTPAIIPDKQKEDNRVTVPNVAGQTRDQAVAKLADASLQPVEAKTFSSTVAQGMVISQSVAAGSRAEKGSSIVIVISKGPEAPGGWTTDASFVDNPYYRVQTKTQYRKQTRTKTRETTSITQAASAGQPATPDGYTYSGREHDGYTDWSGWRDNGTSGGINTNYVQYELYKTLYKYIKNECDCGHSCCYAEYTWVCGKCKTYERHYYEKWDEKNPYNSSIGEYGHDSNWMYYLVRFSPGDDWFYCYTQPNQKAEYYRVRTREDKFRYNYYRDVYGNWSGWSGWQDGPIAGSDTVNVETKTVYYYTAY